jgi:hypothetical protein
MTGPHTGPHEDRMPKKPDRMRTAWGVPPAPLYPTDAVLGGPHVGGIRSLCGPVLRGPTSEVQSHACLPSGGDRLTRTFVDAIDLRGPHSEILFLPPRILAGHISTLASVYGLRDAMWALLFAGAIREATTPRGGGFEPTGFRLQAGGRHKTNSREIPEIFFGEPSQSRGRITQEQEARPSPSRIPRPRGRGVAG